MRVGKVAAFATLLSALVPAAGAGAQAGADLNISPKRVVLGDGQRSATVYIFNQGDQPATYTVELVDRTMAPDGEITAAAGVPTSPTSSARSLVEYTPHLITLAPKQSQSIRIRVRRPDAPGEYRSHLSVTAKPPEDIGLTAERAAGGNEAGALAVRVIALFSISIPVIVREGPVSASAAIEHPAMVPPAAAGRLSSVRLDLVRRGAGSLYGDIEIYAGQGRSERRVGITRGVAVYPEIERRSFAAPLSEPVKPGEPIRIVYRDDDAHPGAQLATVSLVAP
jgi:hypothetical protein